MKTIWFKRKRYGWGWTPCTWQGWLLTVAYVVLMIYLFRTIDSTSHSGSDTLIGFSLPFISFTFLFILICYKTGESPRWQWGERIKENR